MNVEELIPYLPVFMAGAAVGSLNHLGLWYTVRRMPGAANPALVFAVSMAVRYGAMAGVFYLFLRLGWEDLLAAFAGAVIAGFVFSRALRPPPPGHWGGAGAGQRGGPRKK